MIINLENIEKSFSSYYFSKFKSGISVKGLRMAASQNEDDLLENPLHKIFEITSKIAPLRSRLCVEGGESNHPFVYDIDFCIGEDLLFWVDLDDRAIVFKGEMKKTLTFQEATEEELLFQISDYIKY